MIEPMDKMLIKAADASVKDQGEGVVEAIVSATEIPDMSGDIIASGAFARSLQRRNPKGLAAHDWAKPVARTLAAEEIEPGDKTLPERWLEAGAGAVRILGEYNLADPVAAAEYGRVKFFGPEQEWSVGMFVLAAEPQEDYTRISEVDWVEWSSVVAGANPLTGTLAVKELREVLAKSRAKNELERLADRLGDRDKASRLVAHLAEILTPWDVPRLEDLEKTIERWKWAPYVSALVERLGRLLVLSAIPPHDTDVTDQGDWDGPEMVRRAPSEREALRALHAWVDSEGNPDAKASYKLPHHIVSESGEVGAAHIRGVRAALATLSGARGGVDIPDADVPGVRRHLEAHVQAWESKIAKRREEIAELRRVFANTAGGGFYGFASRA